mmetsp:Transcript_27617/g.73339  ORF Transcript_27617/g.73339 Transcript_27617/m.73339 type:complete len:218 (+) Transcript_27617:3108-3761(+)
MRTLPPLTGMALSVESDALPIITAPAAMRVLLSAGASLSNSLGSSGSCGFSSSSSFISSSLGSFFSSFSSPLSSFVADPAGLLSSFAGASPAASFISESPAASSFLLSTLGASSFFSSFASAAASASGVACLARWVCKRSMRSSFLPETGRECSLSLSFKAGTVSLERSSASTLSPVPIAAETAEVMRESIGRGQATCGLRALAGRRLELQPKWLRT